MTAAKAVRRYGAVTTLLLLAGALAGVLPAPAARARTVQATSSLLYPALFGVAATLARDAWAVGQYQSASGPLRTLIMHWNGTSWTRVPSPDPVPGGDTLNGVAVVSASDAWAVGGKNGRTLILRWNGKVWRQAPSPDLPGALAAVAVTSATDAWAVGLDGPKSSRSIIEHWNGKAWTVMRSPVRTATLDGVAATSASNVWAVGFSGNWQASPVTDGALYSVTALSPRDAWAVGSGSGALIEHWNGTRWTATSVP